MSQADKPKVREIVKKEFDGPLDLVKRRPKIVRRVDARQEVPIARVNLGIRGLLGR